MKKILQKYADTNGLSASLSLVTKRWNSCFIPRHQLRQTCWNSDRQFSSPWCHLDVDTGLKKKKKINKRIQTLHLEDVK